jgi:hypothetical protein
MLKMIRLRESGRPPKRRVVTRFSHGAPDGETEPTDQQNDRVGHNLESKKKKKEKSKLSFIESAVLFFFVSVCVGRRCIPSPHSGENEKKVGEFLNQSTGIHRVHFARV